MWRRAALFNPEESTKRKGASDISKASQAPVKEHRVNHDYFKLLGTSTVVSNSSQAVHCAALEMEILRKQTHSNVVMYVQEYFTYRCDGRMIGNCFPAICEGIWVVLRFLVVLFSMAIRCVSGRHRS